MWVPAATVPARRHRYGAPRRRKDGTRYTHQGVDVFAPLGTRVYSTVAGTVEHANVVWRGGFSGYGRNVVVKMEDGRRVLVAHLDDVHVEPGDVVAPGALLGTVGTTKFTRADKTGHFDTSKPHIHVELASGPYPLPPQRLDPTALVWTGVKRPKEWSPEGGPRDSEVPCA